MLKTARKEETTAGELQNAKRMIAEDHGDCDGGLEQQDIVDALSGILEKAYDAGEEVVKLVSNASESFISNGVDSVSVFQ